MKPPLDKTRDEEALKSSFICDKIILQQITNGNITF